MNQDVKKVTFLALTNPGFMFLITVLAGCIGCLGGMIAIFVQAACGLSPNFPLGTLLVTFGISESVLLWVSVRIVLGYHPKKETGDE